MAFNITGLQATAETAIRPMICEYDTANNTYCSLPVGDENILKVTVEVPPPETIFSFTPNLSSVSVFEQNKVTINYKIENVTTLNLTGIYVKDTFPSAIASVVPVFNSPGSTCGSEPFSLGAGASCLLTFEITGLKASAEPYIFAPEICDKASEVYCAKPEHSSAVQVAVLSATSPSLQWVSKGGIYYSYYVGVTSLLNIDSEIYAGIRYLNNWPYEGGVYKLNNMGQWIQFGGSLPECLCFVDSLTTDGTDIYAGTTNGVYQFKNGSWQRLDNNKTSLVNAVLYADGELYVAFADAAYRLNVDGSIFERVGSTLFGIRGLYYGDGQLYAGNDAGAYRLTPEGDWQELGISPGAISSLLIFDGELYAGGLCTGVHRFDSTNNKWERVGGSFSGNDCVFSLAEVNGALYAATSQFLPNDVYRLSADGNNWEIAAEGLPKDPDVLSMLSVGGVLYVGTSRAGIWALQ